MTTINLEKLDKDQLREYLTMVRQNAVDTAIRGGLQGEPISLTVERARELIKIVLEG